MTQRQLLTFNVIQGVKLIPDYEKKFPDGDGDGQGIGSISANLTTTCGITGLR